MNIKIFLKIIFIYFYKKEINSFNKGTNHRKHLLLFHAPEVHLPRREEKRREAKGNHILRNTKKKKKKKKEREK